MSLVPGGAVANRGAYQHSVQNRHEQGSRKGNSVARHKIASGSTHKSSVPGALAGKNKGASVSATSNLIHLTKGAPTGLGVLPINHTPVERLERKMEANALNGIREALKNPATPSEELQEKAANVLANNVESKRSHVPGISTQALNAAIMFCILASVVFASTTEASESSKSAEDIYRWSSINLDRAKTEFLRLAEINCREHFQDIQKYADEKFGEFREKNCETPNKCANVLALTTKDSATIAIGGNTSGIFVQCGRNNISTSGLKYRDASTKMSLEFTPPILNGLNMDVRNCNPEGFSEGWVINRGVVESYDYRIVNKEGVCGTKQIIRAFEKLDPHHLNKKNKDEL